MPRVDDFTFATKKILAERAGYRCSFLGCGSPTIGPSDESEVASSGYGMACHIVAASGGPGARRVDHNMTSEDRKHANNGIWMCYSHGKLIDTDENRFSIEILRKWKEIAENIARIMLEKKCEYSDAINYYQFTDLPLNSINIDTLGSENKLIGDALVDSCVVDSWGNALTSVVRDFLIEVIRNAFLHGGATEINFEAVQNKLTLTDNGSEFNPKSLLGHQDLTGGVRAMNAIVREGHSKIIVSTQRREDKNVTTIGMIRTENEVSQITPCSYKISFEEFSQKSRPIQIQISNTYNEIFIILPSYFSLSDVRFMTKDRLNLVDDKRPITFITRDLSSSVLSLIKENHPECTVIKIS